MQRSSPGVLGKQQPEPIRARVKPRLRGISHRYAFIAALLPCVLLVSWAPEGRATLASAVYAASLLGLLGTSAVYHGVHWGPRTRHWVARVDLLMIFVLIAGTYTPVAMLRLEPQRASLVLGVAWGAVVVGGILKTVWQAPPKWASAAVYVAVACVTVGFSPNVAETLGVPATTLMLLGGALYIAGAIVYGLQRPDPIPDVFGYHEVFHALVVAAAFVHFAAIAIYIVPAAPVI